MRYDAEHKQRTRARLLEEAAKAVRAEGPHRVGVAEVMARAEPDPARSAAVLDHSKTPVLRRLGLQDAAGAGRDQLA